MGIAIPQIITPDRATGAQVIDGSLKFDRSKNNFLYRVFSTVGNRKTWTWAGWLKPSPDGNYKRFWGVGGDTSPSVSQNYYRHNNTGTLTIGSDTDSTHKITSQNLRDTGWYHVVIVQDTTDATAADRFRLYLNGERVTSFGTDNNFTQNAESTINNNSPDGNYHALGCTIANGNLTSPTEPFDGAMAQVYFIDGQALEPENFGFTDPLTNTWKPKKYTGTFAIASGTPSVSNGALVIKADGASINGTFVVDGGVKTWTSPDGETWTRDGSGRTSAAAKYLAVGGAGTALRTFYPDAGSGGFTFYMYNGGGEFDGSTSPLTLDLSSQTYLPSQTSSFGGNGFYLPMDGNSPIGQDQSGNGNNWTPVNFGGSVALDNPIVSGALPILNTNQGGTIAGVGVRTDATVAAGVGTCALALPLVGSTDDVSNLIDSRSTTKVATTSGPIGVSTESNFYNRSYYWGSASNTLQYAEQGDELVFGTGDFTIECWVYDDNGHNGGGSGRCYIFDNRVGGSVTGDPPTMVGYVDSHNEFNFYDGDSDITHTVPSTVGKWWHYAVTREGTTTRMFIDGILRGSSTSSTNFTNNGIGVGRATDGGYGWSGYIQDFRVYNGVAKYTSDFVVPSTFPDVLPDTPSGVSGGSKLTKVTNGAVYFDGTGDYLQAASVSWNPNTSNFTIECFIYLDTAANEKFIAGGFDWFWLSCSYTGGSSGVTSGKFGLSMRNSDNDTWYSVSSTTSFTSGRWYHVAATWDGTYQRMFVDGVLEATSADRSSVTWASKTLHVDIGGINSNTGYTIDGYISNLRIIDGTAQYTSNFTPPAAPLTNVTNTEVLCCQSVNDATTAAVGIVTAYNGSLPTVFGPFNTDINTVRGQETGYPTMSSLAKNSSITLEDGNLRITQTDSHGQKKIVYSNAQIPNGGKWYVEWHIGGPGCTLGFGINGSVEFRGSDTQIGTNLYSWGYEPNGNLFHNGNQGGSYPAATGGEVIGMTIDTSGPTVTAQWYQNGALIRNSSNTAAEFTGIPRNDFVVMMSQHSPNYDTVVNFGQKPFKFPPPDGFQPLSAANVRPDKVIPNSDQYVGVVTFIGNGGTQNVGFGSTMNFDGNPDLVWIKAMDDAYGFAIFDTLRGVNKRLRTDDTSVEQSMTTGLTSFDHNGFTVGSHNSVNESPDDYVAWCWRAGGDKDTYNIDNVGYSTSVDVGFDAGGLNDVAYNSSRTWSSNMVTTGNSGNWHASYPVTNAFNGNHTNYAHGNADGSVSATVTLTFNPAIACEENVTFMGGFTNTTSGTGTISINGGQTVGVITSRGNDPAATDVTLVPFTGDISTIVINKTSGGAQGMIIYGFKIDGVELLDNGVTPTYNYPTAPSTGCSVGTKQGFSIVSYTGNSTNPSTHAHGLLKAPQFVIIKNRDRSTNGDWIVGHVDANDNIVEKDHRDYGGFKEGNQLFFSSATTDGGSSNYFSNARPDRFTFTVKDNYQVNYSGEDYIAYLWHDVPGLQKFGSYVANGNADGPLVEVGFRPAIVWLKPTTRTGNWTCIDVRRDPYNLCRRRLSMNTADNQATGTADTIDILSNGFKCRSSSGDVNDGTNTYVYCAWAEAPAVDLFGGNVNAR